MRPSISSSRFPHLISSPMSRHRYHFPSATTVNASFVVPYFAPSDFCSQIFKTHPLILNYEHLNDSVDNPFHPVIKEHVEYHSDGNVTIHELEIERAYPNTALLSMCLMFGCFFIAYFLRHFKNGHYLPGPVRSTLCVWTSCSFEKPIRRFCDFDHWVSFAVCL